MDQLDKEPSGASGVKEGHLVTAGSRARFLVDELQSLFLQTGEGFGEVRNPIGDVMKAWASPVKEASDRGVCMYWLDELDGPYEKDPHALVCDLLHGGTGVTGHELEQGAGFFEGSNGHGDVVQWVRKHVFYGA